MQKGDVLGHEFMGEVVEVGPGVAADRLKVGDRVIVPFCMACGNCFFCRKQLYSCCDNTNPNAELAEQFYGFATAGLFGYSHLTGGYAGGQAEYVRVPFADVSPLKEAFAAGEDILECFAYAAYVEENAYRQYMAMQIGDPYVFSEAEQEASRTKLWSPSLFKKTWDHYHSKIEPLRR
mgnify:CR=1 FL=1